MGWLHLSSESRHFLETPVSKSLPSLHVCAQSLQSCLTLCDPLDCSPAGSFVHGIFQERILVCVGMPSSRGLSLPRDRTYISYIKAGRFFATGKPISLSRYQQWLPFLFAFRPTSGHSKPRGPRSGLANYPGFLCCFCPCPNTLVFSEIILASTSPHRIEASWRLNPNIIKVISELRKAWIKGFHRFCRLPR